MGEIMTMHTAIGATAQSPANSKNGRKRCANSASRIRPRPPLRRP
jgi:hypothetical protein